MPYTGLVADVLEQMAGGLKSGMVYIGAKNLLELKKAKFIQITPASLKESHPHDLASIDKAVNY